MSQEPRRTAEAGDAVMAAVVEAVVEAVDADAPAVVVVAVAAAEEVAVIRN